MFKLNSNGRVRLLDDQDHQHQEEEIIYAETAFVHQHQTHTRDAPRAAHAHRGGSVYSQTPLLASFTSSPWGNQKWTSILLRALLCVAVVGGMVWATRRLYTSYRSSWSVTVTEQHYRDRYLLWHLQSVESRNRHVVPVCAVADDNHRFDCFPGPGASQVACELRGCCWRLPSGLVGQAGVNGAVGRPIDVPYCYFPSNYPSYEVAGIQATSYGYRVSLASARNASLWPGNLQHLYMDVFIETATRLHFKITDAAPGSARYEVPLQTDNVSHKVNHPEYVFRIKNKPFAFTVSRKSTGATIFDSSVAPLLYGDQFLQMSTILPSGFLYGLGERYGRFARNATSWQQLSLWARDQTPRANMNLYGVHPFFMSLEPDGSAHGVFLLNSNAMDLDLHPYPALTYRTIGGVLDFYVLLGPSPEAVIQQYSAVIGRPAMPPYWALGFHLCRWGYNTTAGLTKVINRMRKAAFPYDVQWMDIDYMDSHLDWTYDKDRYAGLPDVVKDIHDHDQHFVMIVDPGISSQRAGKYPPYDSGLKEGIFVKDYKGNPIEGQVWPGKTVFPDFSNPRTETWWYNSATAFHNMLSFDGLWTDMNEPSNFVMGSTSGCSKNKLDNPPYTPGIIGGHLASNTLCASAQHHLGSHFDLHSLYGHMEARVSHRVLEKIRGKRSLVITRSTFPSTGRFAGHWSGDNRAIWDDLYYSIPVMLNFQMFGIPLVGADTCGFSGPTSEELCTRWMQLAAFYPFMRNHNTINEKDQDPASFSSTAQDRMRTALVLRYSLLPYLYTLFYKSHSEGNAVVNALSFVYPRDAATYSMDRQFMWGKGLLISPVLTQGETTVKAYFPRDTWYALSTGTRVPTSGAHVTLAAPLDAINVHVRGGSVIPRQHPGNQTTTGRARRNPFDFIVALDTHGEARGALYWDDGETIDAAEKGLYLFLNMTVQSGLLVCNVTHAGYKPALTMRLDGVTIMGVMRKPEEVTVNATPTIFTWNSNTKVLVLKGLKLDMTTAWTVQWIKS